MVLSRITFSSNQLLIRDNLLRVQKDYQDATVPATTGRRINTLSDDASVISQLFYLRSEVKANEQYQRNITAAQLFLNYSASRVTLATDVLERIRGIALQGGDAGTSTDQREQLLNMIDEMKDELLDYANARYEGRYIFSGTATTTQPFQNDPVTFEGNSSDMVIQASQETQITANLDGNELFMGNTDTAVSTSLLTSLKNSDGVNLDLESGDTITIAGTLGTGFSTTYTVTATSTLANLATAVQTALRAATGSSANETAAVQADGSIKVTSGTSAITGLTLSVTDKDVFNTAFTYPTPITAGGGTGSSDTLLSGTGEDVFDVIDDLRQALADGDQTAFETHLERLDTSLEQVRLGEVTIGTRMQQLDVLSNSMGEDRIRIMDNLSIIQDASIDQSLSDLVSKESILKIVYSTSSRIMSVLSGLNLNG